MKTSLALISLLLLTVVAVWAHPQRKPLYTGTVKFPTGYTPERAYIVFHPVDSFDNKVDVVVTSSDDGVFSVEVPDGLYDVFVSAPCTGPGAQLVAVHDGTSRVREFQLTETNWNCDRIRADPVHVDTIPSKEPSRSSVQKVEPTLVTLFKPLYPPLARMAGISGEVFIEVTVRPNGTVDAVVVSGYPMLRVAALDSANKSQFECRHCTAPMAYSFVYTFKAIEVAMRGVLRNQG